MAATSRWASGDTAGAAERLESVLSLARLMRAGQIELAAMNSLCAILLAAGELDRTIEVGENGLALSKSRGELWNRGYLLNYLAQANWLRGIRNAAKRWHARQPRASTRSMTGSD
jgi:hypothetical protein